MTRHFDHASAGADTTTPTTTSGTTAVRPPRPEETTGRPHPAAEGPTTTRTSTGTSTGTDTGLRWGAVWAGALVALPVFLVLELLFVAFGWLDLGTQQSAAASIVSAVLALVAFLVGGLLAGRVAGPARSDGGLLHGVLVWALATAGIVAVAGLGGGMLAGDVGALFAGVTNVPPPTTGSLAQSTADAGGWGALWLGVSVVAAAIGGVAGNKARR